MTRGEVISTRTQRITMDEGFVQCIVLDGSFIDISDIKENVACVFKLGNGEPIPVLVDIRGASGVSREARAYLASEETAKAQSAVALVTKPGLSHLIGSFFLGLNKTIFPVRMFTNSDEAKKWLKQYV